MARLRLYTDENVDVRVAEGLRQRGVQAHSAAGEGMLGATAEDQFDRATALGAVIFTHDHHFIELAELIRRRGEHHFGVIFVELHRLSLGECIKRLSLYADVLSAGEMADQVEYL